MMNAQEAWEMKLSAMIDEQTWKIWAYVRENRNSLDSERGCKMIRDGFELAIQRLKNDVTNSFRSENRAKEKLTECRKELNQLKKELKELRRSQELLIKFGKDSDVSYHA